MHFVDPGHDLTGKSGKIGAGLGKLIDGCDLAFGERCAGGQQQDNRRQKAVWGSHIS
jgi:hypothetical protein